MRQRTALKTHYAARKHESVRIRSAARPNRSLGTSWNRLVSPAPLDTPALYFLNSSYDDSDSSDDDCGPDTTSAIFIHGVASGDPLADAAMLWTRAVPSDEAMTSVVIRCKVALDAGFAGVVNDGVATLTADSDWTLKVNACGLAPATVYFFRFLSSDEESTNGQFQTLSDSLVDEVKLGVVSCSNHPTGFFHVYRELTARTELDTVVHLGDYIYEYATGE